MSWTTSEEGMVVGLERQLLERDKLLDGYKEQLEVAINGLKVANNKISALKAEREKGVIRFALGTAYEIATMQTDIYYAGKLLEDAGISSRDRMCAEVIKENDTFAFVMAKFNL